MSQKTTRKVQPSVTLAMPLGGSQNAGKATASKLAAPEDIDIDGEITSAEIKAPHTASASFPFHVDEQPENVADEVSEPDTEDGIPIAKQEAIPVSTAKVAKATDELLHSLHEVKEKCLTSRPVIAARRTQRWGPGASRTTAPVEEELFANGADDVIRFNRNDDDSGEDKYHEDHTSSDSELDAGALAQRRQRKISRILDTIDKQVKSLEEHEEEEETEAVGNEEDHSDVGSVSCESCSESGSCSSFTSASSEARAHPVAKQPPMKSMRTRFEGVTFESYRNTNVVGGCYHTLVSLSSPLTIRGPCAVIGIHGETLCGGFVLGKKHFVLGPTHAIVLQPMQKFGTQSSQLKQAEFEALVRKKASSSTISECLNGGAFAGSCFDGEVESACVGLDPEELFGAADWGWIASTLESWLARLAASTCSVVLVMQRYDPGELMTKQVAARSGAHVANKRSEKTSIPKFFSRTSLHPIDASLLPVVRKAVAQSQSIVAVVGGQNIGKSTLCRSLANAFFSLHGTCYWMDLDLGRPEFCVSGTISVSKVCRPLTKESDVCAVQWMKVIHVGGSRMNNPNDIALAIESLCDYVLSHSDIRPLVINSHGWIQSSGRRATVEVLRRVVPHHVIHLARHDDAKWVVPEIIFQPRWGLNKRTVNDRFLNGVPCGLPEAKGARNNQPAENARQEKQRAEMQVHIVPVIRVAAVRKTNESRRDNWRAYFKNFAKQNNNKASTRPHQKNRFDDVTVSSAPSNALSTLVEIPLSSAMLFGTADEEDDCTIELFCGAIAKSVVGICLVPTPEASSRKRSRSGTVDGTGGAVRMHSEILSLGATMIGFGFVVSRSEQMSKSGEARVRLPFGSELLVPKLQQAAGAKQLIGIVACPYDRFDTSFLK